MKKTKDFTCSFKRDGWDAECEMITKYFCPYAAIPIMDEAIKKGFKHCPFAD